MINKGFTKHLIYGKRSKLRKRDNVFYQKFCMKRQNVAMQGGASQKKIATFRLVLQSALLELHNLAAPMLPRKPDILSKACKKGA